MAARVSWPAGECTGLGGGTRREGMLFYPGYSGRQLSWVGGWPRVPPRLSFKDVKILNNTIYSLENIELYFASQTAGKQANMGL